jgi:hypothetical protein
MVLFAVLIVQLLTLTAAGRLLQVPAEAALQLSAMVPVGVAPEPVHVITPVIVEAAFRARNVGLAESTVDVVVLPVTENDPVPEVGM